MNNVRQRRDHTSIVMENPSVPEDHPGAGQMVLTALAEDARPYVRWTDPGALRALHRGIQSDLGPAPSLPKEYARYVNNRPIARPGPARPARPGTAVSACRSAPEPGEQGRPPSSSPGTSPTAT